MTRRPAALAVVLLLVVPSLAHASTATTVTLDGPAAATLRAQGVRFVAIPPATLKGKDLQLPTRSFAGSTMTHSGGLQLRGRPGRTLALTSVRRTAGRRPLLTVMLAGRRASLARLSSATAPTMTVNAVTAEVIRRRLGLSRAPRGRLGSLRTVAGALSGPSTPTTTTPSPGSTATPTSPTTPEPGKKTVCAAAAPGSAPGPARPTRPATARDVVTGSLTWHVRDSFTDYIASGEGTSAVDGAVAAAPSGSPPLAREFSFPFRDGWVDPVSGAAAVRFTGCVRFTYAAHGIAIEAQEPEIELAPGAARAVYRFSGASAKAGRSVLGDLTWAAPATSGETRTWNQIPAKIPVGAADSVFAGFYFPGDPFGWFTLTATAS